MSHLNRKILAAIAVLAVILAATPLAVRPQAYPPGDWKFKIADDWGLWGEKAKSYDPVTGGFGAVAYLYNSTPSAYPTFEDWRPIGSGTADENGWIKIQGLPGNVWDMAAPGDTIEYTLIVKLKIGNVVTPITIFNETVLTIGDNYPSYGTPQAVGLYDLLNRTIINGGVYPGKSWITGYHADFVDSGCAGLEAWLYYVAMQPLDENGFPITGAQLRVLYDSNYLGETYIKNTPVTGLLDELYGIWTTNGTLGDEFIPDIDIDNDETIYDPNLKVGWVILRVPRISPMTGTGSSLVNAMTFVWLYKTNTTIGVIDYRNFGYPGGNAWTPNPSPMDVLRGNATHSFTVQVEWTGIRLLDCNENPWWTMKAEVYGFDEAYRSQYGLKATKVAPGTYLLRYPVPVPMPVVNYDFETGMQGWHSLANAEVSGTIYMTGPYGGISGVLSCSGTMGTAQVGVDPSPYVNLEGKTVSVWVYATDDVSWAQIFAQDADWTWRNSVGSFIPADTWTRLTWTIPGAGGGWDPTQVRRLGIQGGFAGTFYLDDFDWPEATTTTITLGVEWYYSTVATRSFRVGGGIDDLEGSLNSPIEVVCDMTWVDVNFWSSSELPQQVSDFAVKIWLPSTIGYRNAEPLTVWWNGRGGFVVLPDMEYYAGPNPSTLDELDPYGIASPYGFEEFWEKMSQNAGNAGGFGGSGWLPTRIVGWVDFEVYYEGIKVLDTYAEGSSLKLPCCEAEPPSVSACHYNFSLSIYEIGWNIVLEACGQRIPAPTGVPFFFRHPNPQITEGGMVGPKTVTNGKVDIVKAPVGNYSDFVIVWHMSVLKPYKIGYMFDNGTEAELPLDEPIRLKGNMRNIILYFKLWNLTVDTWSQDPFRIIKVDVQLFSESNFEIAPGIGLSKRQIDQITDPENNAYMHVLPSGWEIYKVDTSGLFPKIYYKTDIKTVTPTSLPSWNYLPEKDYWIWVRVPKTSDEASNAGFRAVDANATLYWSGDPWNKPLYLDRCYGPASPYRINTYVYNPRLALKNACGEPLVFGESDLSALILAEPWSAGSGLIVERQQIDPYAGLYNAYLIRKNATDAKGVVTISSVNASPVSKPNDPDLWNPKTQWKAEVYPDQSRYLIGYSEGSGPIKATSPKYRFMVYYKGVLVYNESIVLSNPYVNKETTLKTSVYPYVFRAVNSPLEGEEPRFGVANLKVTVYWAGLNTTWWPTKALVTETPAIEFSLLNASKLLKSFNMSVVKRLWGPQPPPGAYVWETLPFTPTPPFFSSMVRVESELTDSEGKAAFLIPVWNYSVTPHIYTWTKDDRSDPNLKPLYDGPRNPWNKDLGPLSINLKNALVAERTASLFGTPVYANFTTVPGLTNNIPAEDIVRLVATLTESKYCRWMQRSMNATGLVNPTTDIWRETKCVSLNMSYRTGDGFTASNPYAGVGLLVGGAYQGRVGETDGCYARAQEKVPANDLAIVVRNIDKVGLPDQKVTVIREPIYIWRDGEKVRIASSEVWLEDYTPTEPNVAAPDYYKLYLRSSSNRILWGIYNVTLRTENLTKGMSNEMLRLNDPQFLTMRLFGGDVDWSSGTHYLDWPALLRVTILTVDGRPLEKAWVYVVDAYTRGNATAALTDEYGHAGTLKVTRAVPPLRIEPGDRVDIGLNLLRGWYWLDEDRRLTGEPVNPNWEIFADPVQPIGGNIQQVTYEDRTGWARFYGKYYIIVYYKPLGCDVRGPYTAAVVYDSYTDEPQHQYIYLGIAPETSLGATVDYQAKQAKTFDRAQVRDLRVMFKDDVGRALTDVSATASHPLYGWSLRNSSGTSNIVTFTKLPMREGTSYKIRAEWTSPVFETKASVESSVKEAESEVTMPVYDVTLRIVTRRGTPVIGASVTVGGHSVGVTSAEGEITLTQVPKGDYGVKAKWKDIDLGSIEGLSVSATVTRTLTAYDVYLLTVRVRGAQGQALEGATVSIKRGDAEILTKLTDKDGKAEVELPKETYTVVSTYSSLPPVSKSVTLTKDDIVELSLDVFIELFGLSMTLAQFLLFIVMIIIIVLVLAIVIHEYHIYRRKRLPQLFGAAPAPK
ncbi:MAG: MSCRAMM family protein [Thermoproteota archaeon]